MSRGRFINDETFVRGGNFTTYEGIDFYAESKLVTHFKFVCVFVFINLEKILQFYYRHKF